MKINKIKKQMVLQAFFYLFLSTGVAAQELKIRQDELSIRPTAFVMPGGLLRETCRTQRLYGLCGPFRDFRAPNFPFWSRPAARSGQGFKIFQIASLFMDSITIGEFGDWKIKISIDIR